MRNSIESCFVFSGYAYEQEDANEYYCLLQLCCADHQRRHHGPRGGQKKTFRRKNPGILLLSYFVNIPK